MADQNITIRLKAVQLLGFELTEAGRKLTVAPATEDYQFNWNVNVTGDVPSKTIHCVLKTSLGSKRDVPMIPFVQMEVQALFDVLNFDELVIDPKTQKPKIPIPIISKLAEIVISTARGIFLVNVAGTIFNKALMPLINTQELQPPKSASEPAKA